MWTPKRSKSKKSLNQTARIKCRVINSLSERRSRSCVGSILVVASQLAVSILSRHSLFVDVHELFVIPSGCEAHFIFSPRFTPHRLEFAWMTPSPLHLCRQIACIAGLEKQPCAAFGDNFRHSSEIRADHWCPARECFDKAHPESF